MSSGLQADDRDGACVTAAENQTNVPILIGIGSNMSGPFGSSLQSCLRGLEAMAGLPFLEHTGRSDWYDTEPVPRSMQPNFTNGVATFAWRRAAVAPALLLRALQSIELEAGRVRAEPDAARTLDLDIIAIGGLVRAAPDPVLPHPRAHLRRFVLEPLRDVVPGWVHPVLHRDVDELLASLPIGGTRRLAAAALG